ncbi:MAG: hypothetical protein ACI35O_12345 [Bacillaceae bacterium]
MKKVFVLVVIARVLFGIGFFVGKITFEEVTREIIIGIEDKR